ncbi:hypothetical protein EHQ81_07010 [Leptospira selangorensis]|uniref:Uncharacterized protein n=1 Tax=Leptospira selangorensis TaxID=2484982 RepID=A0A4R9GC66_9LEPT|nr:hypothetical protein [Leptospira selangorensis]TGK09396.1 hypothetical protein EHO58_03185 [Leptospira selangorensis]TGM16126.1 hypothetical protein EHQ81_07010 [Leptospira selangorensis]TGM17923.1 hypothetical protein EHQ82_12695 [Leptospira selangorensis]
MEDRNKEKLDQEIFRRLESYEWSDNISAKIMRRRKIASFKRFFIFSFSGLVIVGLGLSSFYFQPEGESESGDWQVLIEEQIEGTFEDAETSMQTPDLNQEDTSSSTVPSSSLMDMDALIETSFERR